MDVKQAILARRSVRTYLAEPIAECDLIEILELGVMAPSAVNRQPWYFAAVHSPEALAKLTQVMEDLSRISESAIRAQFVRHPQVAEETVRFLKSLGGAQACILAFGRDPGVGMPDAATVQSIAAAMENMLLAAVDKGMGGCWMTAPCQGTAARRLRELFAPDKGSLVAAMTLGYPAAAPPAPTRKSDRYRLL